MKEIGTRKQETRYFFGITYWGWGCFTLIYIICSFLGFGVLMNTKTTSNMIILHLIIHYFVFVTTNLIIPSVFFKHKYTQISEWLYKFSKTNINDIFSLPLNLAVILVVITRLDSVNLGLHLRYIVVFFTIVLSTRFTATCNKNILILQVKIELWIILLQMVIIIVTRNYTLAVHIGISIGIFLFVIMSFLTVWGFDKLRGLYGNNRFIHVSHLSTICRKTSIETIIASASIISYLLSLATIHSIDLPYNIADPSNTFNEFSKYYNFLGFSSLFVFFIRNSDETT